MKGEARPPVWVMGLSGASFGLVGGFPLFALAQALAARHVPETTIAPMIAVAVSPGFWSFLFSPMLDVWFSRRTYALALIGTSAVLIGISVMLFDHLVLLEVTVTAGYAANQLYYGALGGWLSTVCGRSEENRLSAWLTVANIAGFGVMAVLGGELIRSATPAVAAVAIAVLILLPVLLFIGIPAPGPDRRLAKESFQAFWVAVFALLRRRQVWLALLLFVAPCGSFSLTNMLSGLGGDFGATPRLIGLLGGVGTALAGVCGSLLLPTIAKYLRLRPLYLVIGIVGGLFTLGVLLLPRNPSSFALSVLGENIFQSLAITCSIAIAFETIGQANPLAATNFAVLSAAYNVPLTYMLVIDGRGYGRWGLSGAFAVDAALGLIACVVMAIVLLYLERPRLGRPAVTLST
jgi:PAT family beta-lactamase induction signal transducer AmpG